MFVQMIRPILQAFGVLMMCILPAWPFLKRARLDKLTRLSVAILINFTFFYLLEYGAYLLSLPQYVPLALYAVALIASIRPTERRAVDTPAAAARRMISPTVHARLVVIASAKPPRSSASRATSRW